MNKRLQTVTAFPNNTRRVNFKYVSDHVCQEYLMTIVVRANHASRMFKVVLSKPPFRFQPRSKRAGTFQTLERWAFLISVWASALAAILWTKTDATT